MISKDVAIVVLNGDTEEEVKLPREVKESLQKDDYILLGGVVYTVSSRIFETEGIPVCKIMIGEA